MRDLTIVIRDDGVPIYRQIDEAIRALIRRGDLSEGERLPSSRALASQLGVARSTVETAYDQLEAEGYLTAQQGRGVFVAPLEDLFVAAEARPTGDSLPTEPSTPEKTSADPDHPDLIAFSSRTVELGLFPYATWQRIGRRVLKDQGPALFSHGDPRGEAELREALSHYLRLARGVEASPDRILVGAGNDVLLMLLCQILPRQRRIGMEYLGYGRAAQLFGSMGETLLPLPMDAQGILPAALTDRDLDLIYVMPARQYPTGTALPIGRRAELLRWAASREGRYILEDDYDSEFRYRGRPIPALAGEDPERVIYIGTFSKSIAPAVRVSYMVLPPALAAVRKERIGFCSSTVSRLDQQVLTRFITEGYFERYVGRMRGVYKERRDLLRASLEGLRDRFEIRGEAAGLHLILEARGEVFEGPKGAARAQKIEEEWIQRARDWGVLPESLQAHRICPAENVPADIRLRPSLLLGYAALPAESIREGARRLTEAL